MSELKNFRQNIYDNIREGMAEPGEAETTILAAVKLLPQMTIERLPLSLILHYGFEPSRCFSNVAKLADKDFTQVYGWQHNVGEEAFELHSVLYREGRYVCVTPPFDYYPERKLVFIHDTELTPIMIDGEFQGCMRGAFKAPRMLRMNVPSTRYFYERLLVHLEGGADIPVAQELASIEANARDGKPMHIVTRTGIIEIG